MGSCELCDALGGEVLWQDARCRIVRVGGAEGAAFPGFCRVVWQAHVREMSDLADADRRYLLDLLHVAEAVVRDVAHPDKMNLASFGNVVPHLHWHVIPRWQDDSHFPAPIWTEARRPSPPRPSLPSRALRDAFAARLGDRR